MQRAFLFSVTVCVVGLLSSHRVHGDHLGEYRTKIYSYEKSHAANGKHCCGRGSSRPRKKVVYEGHLPQVLRLKRLGSFLADI
ncbi:hypothetical protein J6590_047276 [Homalodisca vitripennis]|nr:hypothetical protein J6590_047276 [Homalodisca vitripennis]